MPLRLPARRLGFLHRSLGRLMRRLRLLGSSARVLRLPRRVFIGLRCLVDRRARLRQRLHALQRHAQRLVLPRVVGIGVETHPQPLQRSVQLRDGRVAFVSELLCARVLGQGVLRLRLALRERIPRLIHMHGARHSDVEGLDLLLQRRDRLHRSRALRFEAFDVLLCRFAKLRQHPPPLIQANLEVAPICLLHAGACGRRPLTEAANAARPRRFSADPARNSWNWPCGRITERVKPS